MKKLCFFNKKRSFYFFSLHIASNTPHIRCTNVAYELILCHFEIFRQNDVEFGSKMEKNIQTPSKNLICDILLHSEVRLDHTEAEAKIGHPIAIPT